MRQNLRLLFLILLAIFMTRISIAADTWPIKPIRFVVGFTAGGQAISLLELLHRRCQSV